MLCPVMQMDFTDGVGRYDEAGCERYSDADLKYGILWADSYLADGYTKEPMKSYDLVEFRRWCVKKLFTNRESRVSLERPPRSR